MTPPGLRQHPGLYLALQYDRIVKLDLRREDISRTVSSLDHTQRHHHLRPAEAAVHADLAVRLLAWKGLLDDP